MTSKRFSVTFEMEAIPYNKETFELLGPCFMEEYPETIFAKEDIGEVLRMARVENCMSVMRMRKSPISQNMKYYEARQKRIDVILDLIENTIKVEPIN